MGTLGGNHICFRKSFSQTFNFIRLDFFSQMFPFFRYHEWGAVCDRNLSHWIPAKGPCRWWGLSEEMIFFPKVCVTNLEFVQVTIRFLFRVTEISRLKFHFFGCFVVTQPSSRNAHKRDEGKTGSARLESTPAIDLELKCTRTHM